MFLYYRAKEEWRFSDKSEDEEENFGMWETVEAWKD